jgi:hypothetical protein
MLLGVFLRRRAARRYFILDEVTGPDKSQSPCHQNLSASTRRTGLNSPPNDSDDSNIRL